MEQRYKLHVKKPSIAILIAFIPLASIGAVVFTPGLPSIIRYFGVSERVGQLPVAVFLLAYALGQLIYGPIAARWGRKPTIYLGISVGILGSILAGLSGYVGSFAMLLSALFVMALGTSSALVLTFIIINDFYYQEDARKIVPLISTAFAVLPFLFVTMGGYLVRFASWESCFYLFALYCLGVLFACTRLPETAPDLDPLATRWGHIIKKYGEGFSSFHLVGFAIVAGGSTALLYLFSSTAPFIVINFLGVPPDVYGLLSLTISAAYLSGNLLSAHFSKSVSAVYCIRMGLLLMGAATSLFCGLFWSGIINVYSFYIPIFFTYLSIPFVFSNAAVLATAQFHDKPTASSLMNFINMAVGISGVFVIGFLPFSPLVAMPALFVAIWLCILPVFFSLKKICKLQ